MHGVKFKVTISAEFRLNDTTKMARCEINPEAFSCPISVVCARLSQTGQVQQNLHGQEADTLSIFCGDIKTEPKCLWLISLSLRLTV